MTDLQKITTDIPPTSLTSKQNEDEKCSFEDVVKELTTILAVDFEHQKSFETGRFSEKNKTNNLFKILIDTICFVLDQDDPKISNPSELLIHRQNKKFTKDSIVFLLNSLKSYSIDEKKLKLMLAGKLIQSLRESKD